MNEAKLGTVLFGAVLVLAAAIMFSRRTGGELTSVPRVLSDRLDSIEHSIERLNSSLDQLRDRGGAFSESSLEAVSSDPGRVEVGPSATDREIANLYDAIELHREYIQTSLEEISRAVDKIGANSLRAAFESTSGTSWVELNALAALLERGGESERSARASVAFMTPADVMQRFGRPTAWNSRRLEYFQETGAGKAEWGFAFDEFGVLSSVSFRPPPGAR